MELLVSIAKKTNLQIIILIFQLFVNNLQFNVIVLKKIVGSLSLTALQIRMTTRGPSGSGQLCPSTSPAPKTRAGLAVTFTTIEWVNDVPE